MTSLDCETEEMLAISAPKLLSSSNSLRSLSKFNLIAQFRLSVWSFSHAIRNSFFDESLIVSACSKSIDFLANICLIYHTKRASPQAQVSFNQDSTIIP